MTQEMKMKLFEEVYRVEEDALYEETTIVFSKYEEAFRMLKIMGLEKEYSEWAFEIRYTEEV